MSIVDRCLFSARSAPETRNIGVSLASSWYRRRGLLLLQGELGAGKTTFVQGFAEGLGIKERVVSPTYALEQRYGETLSHIDLYRLDHRQAQEFLDSLDDFPGVRVVEWSDRVRGLSSDVSVHIHEESIGRTLSIECTDIDIPSRSQIDNWRDEVALPPHIAKHCDTVADIAVRVADHLLSQNRMVRRHAIEAAARTHDLFRFVDFQSLTGDKYFMPQPEQSELWKSLKEQYGTPHEAAVATFLTKQGYPDIARIVRSHRGFSFDGNPADHAHTTEQMVVSYADKRVIFDTPATIDERFDDFKERYGKGKETPAAKAWRKEMKRIEAELFPNGVPF